jgi:Heterokaryon incompatibility protein (HET)
MYSKLPGSRSLRLLDIVPGQTADAVEVNLLVVNDLDTAPDFEALSYVWGTPDDPVDILCNNEVVSVTQNLSGALRRLRHTDKSRRVWIDALCINQNDLDERAQQVSFMRKIYSRAKRVVIWLGPDNGSAAKAISIITYASNYTRERSRKVPTDEVLFEREDDPNFNTHGEIPPPGHVDWDAVWWFYRMEWFSRVWIIQEVAQDPKADMLIGDLSVPWIAVADAALFFRAKHYAESPQDAENLVQAMIVTATIISWGDAPPLLTVISRFSNFNASNVRDKLFAVIGLSQEGQKLESYPLIQPDYRKSILETFTDLVGHLISAPRGRNFGEGGLDVLGRNEISRMVEHTGTPALDLTEEDALKANDQQNFPSWVPRFDRQVPWCNSLSARDQALSWSTSYDSPVERLSHLSPRRLILKGVRLTTITNAYSSPEYYDRSKPGFMAHNPAISNLYAKVKTDLPNYQGPDSIGEAFAQTITAGRISGSSEDVFHEAQLNKFLEFEETGVQNLESFHIHNVTRSLPGYFMFVTGDGHVGIGAQAQPGDGIWLLFGGRVLYILRPCGGHFTFVGECYVHGFMHGEGMEMWKAGKLKSEWVDLQ